MTSPATTPQMTRRASVQPENTRPSSSYIRKKIRVAATLSMLLFSLFLAALDFSIITTAIPSISQQLHFQTGYVWIGSAYLLASAAVAPVYGKVADIWGRRSALLGAVALLFTGSAICGWSQTIAQLIVGRAVQGSGAGGIIVLVNISISDMWSSGKRSIFLAMTGVVWAVSAGVGPLLGGVFSEYLSWRWIFWINLPCCFAAFVILFLVLNVVPVQATPSAAMQAMDWFGSVSIMGMTILILLSLDFGGVVFPWASPNVLALLVSGIVLLVVFMWWEAKGASSPLIPVRLLNSMAKIGPLLVCFTHGFINVSSWYFLPIYFQAVLGVSPVRSGVLLMPIVVVQAVVGLVTGAVIHRFGCVRPIIWAGMAMTILGFGLFIILDSSTPLVAICAIEVIAALGVGTIFQAPLIAYQATVQPSDVAMATALFGFIRSLSTSISVVVGGVVFQNSVGQQSDYLVNILGEELAQNFSAPNAASNVLTVRLLPSDQQVIVKDAYVSSLQDMWKMYVGVGALGIAAAVFVKKHSLDEALQHETTQVELTRRPGGERGEHAD